MVSKAGGQGLRARGAGRERGVALVLVLGLVALIGAWAANAGYEDLVALRRAENLQSLLRARQASLSAFALARLALKDDARRSQRDDPDEDWAQASPPFPVDEGVVGGRVAECNGRLNLNDLVDDQGRVRAGEVAAARRLFVAAKLDPSLVDALVDWMDADDVPYGAAGAEDAAYFGKPWRVKNARLDDWDELAMVRGFDRKARKALEALATVFPPPAGALSKVNVNTAPKEVLMALFPAMTEADAQALMDARPFDSVAAALNGRPWAAGGAAARLSVSSRIFIVRTEARFGRAVVREEYMLSRQGQRLMLLARRRIGGGA